MIGRNGSYFDPDLALKGHYIITGNTNDNFCNDLLQITDVRKELHRYLLSQGFQAVFFFDYTNMLYCYDSISFQILRGALQESAEPQSNTNRSSSIASTGPFGDNLAGFQRAFGRQNQNRPAPQPSNEPLRLNMGQMRMDSAWQQVIALLRREQYRCALVLSNINSMQNTFSVPALQALQELTAGSSSGNSVVIHIFRGNTMANMLTDQTRYGTDEWNVFFQSVLRPLIETDSAEENRVISLRTPNAMEVRNLLNYFRLQNTIPISIEPTQLQTLADALSYSCARENRNLKQLRIRIEQYAQEQPNTVMNLSNYNVITDLPRQSTALEDLDRLEGLREVKTEMRKLYSSMLARSGQRTASESSSRFTPPPATRRTQGHLLNICLTGHAGTGKSELARLMGRMYYEANVLPQGHLVPASASNLVSPNVGQTARTVRDLVQQAMGGVLFIDEAYSLIKNQHGREAIDQLVNDMTTYEGQFAVIIAGYPHQIERLLQSNEGLASRFGTTFHLPDYTSDEMRRILMRFLERDPDPLRFSPELESQLKVFCDNWTTDHDQKWGNAREAGRLISLMKRNALYRIAREEVTLNPDTPIELTLEDMPEHLRKHLKPKAQSLAEALEQIQGMIGLDNVKKFLKNLADGNLWEDMEPTPGRFIFHGPPGTGKTHVARLMGTMLRQLKVLKRDYVYEVPAQSLLQPDPSIDYGSDHTPTPHEILQAAVDNARGGILFIDEAHQLNDTPEGQALLRALVPIVEHPEYRRDTCFILAGYSAPMRALLTQDDGLARRFPESCRIRFDSYSARELTRILETMARERGQTPSETYLNRSCIALSKFLMNAPENYGNAGYIRDTYLPESIQARRTRLNQKYAGHADSLVDLEVAQSVSAAEKQALTELDIPKRFRTLAGPPGLPIPKEKDIWERIDQLVGKQEIKEYLTSRRITDTAPTFYDNHNETGLHFAVVGPIGCGRHTVTRIMTALWKHLGLLDRDNVRFVSKSDLEDQWIGGTSVKTGNVVENARGGCLAVEYPSSMLPKNSHDNTFGPEALGVLSGAMSDPLGGISIVLLETEEGLAELFRQMPAIRENIARVFRLEDLSPEEMLELFRLKTDESLCFEPELETLLPEFFLNWVSQRGGLGEASKSWSNGTEVDHLVSELIARWTSMGGKTDSASGFPKRLITREMFPGELQSYLVQNRADKDTAMNELMDMVGLNSVKSVIRSLERENRMLSGKKPAPGFYAFLGNPGTGKTTVARLMGGLLRASNALSQGHVIERTAQQLIQRPSGFAEALKLARNGILFIDEAPQLVQWNTGARVIQELLTALEDTKVISCTCIILAGYPKDMHQLIASDPGLSSRFGTNDAMIYFDDYTPEELMRILRDMASRADTISQIRAHRPLKLTSEFEALSLDLFRHVTGSSNRDFGNARYVRNYLRDCYKNLLARLDHTYPDGTYPEEELCTLTEEDVSEKLLHFLDRQQLPTIVPRSHLLTESPGAIDAADYAQRVEYYLQRTVLIECSRDDGREGTGSGTIITQDGCILTCAHVVENATHIRAKVYCPGSIGGDFRWFNCTLMEPVNNTIDMALLKMDGRNFPVMPLRVPDLPIGTAESTMLTGYPLGGLLNDNRLNDLNPGHFEGRINSVQRKHRFNADILHYYLDSRGLHGNSGSPVLSLTDGRMIGVFSGSVAPKDAHNLDELNLFFPIHYFWHYFVPGAPAQEE